MSNTGFLPQGYEVPDAGGHYAKFEVGQTVVRILSKMPLIGYLDWKGEEGSREPVRTPEKQPQIGKDSPKHFWTVVIYNYNLNQIQIWEITQVTIMNAINALQQNPQWGHPGRYDLTIEKSGSGLKTSYSVVPSPAVKVGNQVIEAASKLSVDLTKLWSNDDPFTSVDGTTAVPTTTPATAAAAQAAAVAAPAVQVEFNPNAVKVEQPPAGGQPAPITGGAAAAQPGEVDDLPF